MGAESFEIKKYNGHYRAQILSVWEKSVLATHHFLLPTDFIDIKEHVKTINFNDFEVYCLIEAGLVAGFIGVADKKIEMLFLDPNYWGKGLGKKLLSFAVDKLAANRLDVNEQNVKALLFYQKSGFEIVERTDEDDQGRNYPLLRMKLKQLT